MAGFAFIQITDHHLPENEADLPRGFSPAYSLRAVLRHIAQNTAHRADFILSTGDIVDPATPLGYENLCQMLQLHPAQKPPGPGQITIEGLHNQAIYFMPGNHDDRALFQKYLFSQASPGSLVNTTFHHKSIQFACLDMGADAKATLFSETLEHLTQALSNELPTIIVTHHHVVPVGARWLDEFIADDIDKFWDLLTSPVNRKNILGVISAHSHITYDKAVEGIPVFGVRSTAFPFARVDEPLLTLMPPQYRLFEAMDGKLTSQVYEVEL
jgi:3',5'-cyclic AMP phosphodiesterase CpdA